MFMKTLEDVSIWPVVNFHCIIHLSLMIKLTWCYKMLVKTWSQELILLEQLWILMNWCNNISNKTVKFIFVILDAVYACLVNKMMRVIGLLVMTYTQWHWNLVHMNNYHYSDVNIILNLPVLLTYLNLLSIIHF